MLRTVSLFALLALAACDTTDTVVAEPYEAPVAQDLPAVAAADVATMDAYLAARTALVGAIDAAVEDRAAGPDACWLLPLGKKPCGGPTAYRVYASTAGSAPEVLRLGRALYALDEAANDALGLVSGCVVPPRPVVVFRDGRCTALAPGGAN